MRYLTPVLAAAAIILSTVPASADLGDQLHKLLASDGAAGDWFGRPVAIFGTTAIVGAAKHDDNGSLSGSAYLFNTISGLQITKLLPNDGTFNDRFGGSVAISGTIAIVGAYWDDDNGSNSGSAYLFDTITGAQISKILPNDGEPDEFFGSYVAISGPSGSQIAIVAAIGDNDNGDFSGSAYLFDVSDPVNPVQIAKLLSSDGAAADWFGRSVSISGATAIVGAMWDDDNGNGSGSAYLFDTSTGIQIAKLLPSDGAEMDAFGGSVSISGSTAIVGAWGDDDNDLDSGSAYLFDTITGKQIAKILPDDGIFLDEFGISVAISGDTAIIGTFGDDKGFNSGSAYFFDISDPANPVQIAKLLPDDGAELDYFGFRVAISGSTAIVGAYRDDDNGIDSGSAYLFDAGATCYWDLNGDGYVGVLDLLEVIYNFGPCDGACPADFDGDGEVGVSDLLVLIANFGLCPGAECPWDLNDDGEVNEDDLHEIQAHYGVCEDPNNCPWDIDGNGVVNGLDLQEVAIHFGDCL